MTGNGSEVSPSRQQLEYVDQENQYIDVYSIG